MNEHLKKILIIDTKSFYLLLIFICSLIPVIVFKLTLIPTIIIFIVLSIRVIILLQEYKKESIALELSTSIKRKQNETTNYRDKINQIYQKSFKDSEFNSIFDQHIFLIISLLSDLIDNNLSGIAKERVQSIVNDSLKLYLFNVESAGKMAEVHNNIEINFKEDIENLFNQNKEIIIKLKEFLTKLVLLKVNTSEFDSLINSFEYNLKSLDIIKKVREGK